MRAREITPDSHDIPPGWPRPFYRNNEGRPLYAQWSSAHAASQIMSCHPGRTYIAGARHLCSSCGAEMERGLIFDRQTLIEHGGTAQIRPGTESHYRDSRIILAKMNAADTHYGSPICYRCAVFAATACPYFAALHDLLGDDFPWLVTTGPDDYTEFDETAALHVVSPTMLDRTTTGTVRAEVQAGALHLTGRGADDFPEESRPFVWSPKDGRHVEAMRRPGETLVECGPNCNHQETP